MRELSDDEQDSGGGRAVNVPAEVAGCVAGGYDLLVIGDGLRELAHEISDTGDNLGGPSGFGEHGYFGPRFQEIGVRVPSVEQEWHAPME